MNDQHVHLHGRMVAAAAATALASGLLGGAVAGCDDDFGDANSEPLTTEEEGTDTPENPSGLQQTNSFGYIPEHETTLETEPIEPEGGGIDGDPFELGRDPAVAPTGPAPQVTLTTPAG